jgi:hypothetical protein
MAGRTTADIPLLFSMFPTLFYLLKAVFVSLSMRQFRSGSMLRAVQFDIIVLYALPK